MSSLSLHRRIVNGLGQQISSGKLKPGDPLPTPIGVRASRTALREAVKVLTAKGLVEARPRIGTRVRSREAWHLLDPDVISWQQDAQLRTDLLRRLTEVRVVFEPASAALAAERATSADIMAMEQAYKEMMAATEHKQVSPARFKAADRRFHAAIVAASGNDLLEQIGETVFSALSVSFRVMTTRPGAARASMPAHRAILNAIRRGRPAEARRAMMRLIDHTARELKRES